MATNGQPAEKAKKKETERKTTYQKSEKSSLPTVNTTKEVAKLAGVSHDTIAKESLREENSETAQAQPSPLNLVGVDSSVPTTADKTFEDFIFEPLAEKSTEILIAETRYFMQSTVQNIIGAGLRLLEAKKRIGHGDWKQWLADNISIEYRTAVNYMAIAEKFGGENVKTFAHLSYSACVALLPLPVETAKEYIEGQEQNGTPAALKSVRKIKRDVANLKQKAADNNPTQAELPGEYFPVLNKDIDVPPDVPSPEPSAAEVIEENSSPQITENKPLVTLNTGCEEWCTPEQYIEAARKVMGVIDLDPASSAIAQQTVKAKKYFTRADDGLQYEWAGRIWLNPPYSRGLLDKFVDKLLASTFEAAIVLTDSSTETGWFSRLATRAQMICFSTKRIKFLRPDGTEGNGSPTRGSAFFYFGNHSEKFREVFQQFGWFASFIPVDTQGEARKS